MDSYLEGMSQSTKYLKHKDTRKEYRRSAKGDRSSKNIQCFECKGFGHVRFECTNLVKKKRKALTSIKSGSDSDSDDELALKNFVAFTTFVSPESATGHVKKSNDGSASDVESFSDEELAKNYETLYEHLLKRVEENSLLTKEKVNLEAQVAEAQKYAVQKEVEATQARVQLEETQKQLRMLNNSTNQLNHFLNIGKSPMERHGLGFNGESSNNETIFVSRERRETAITSATDPKPKVTTWPATTMKTATASEKTAEIQSAPRRVFRHVCHHCGVAEHIRPRCYKLLRENHRRKQAYYGRFRGPTCYRCGIQGHVQRYCFINIQRFCDEGPRFKNVWVRKDDLYRDGVMGYQLHRFERGRSWN
ncbi:unnamed protein product [Arabis nemorensis]|uniref:CCHC-type domain-containing protein n=1 Tax=Arabis nemorensis TaxID=586526 RepID=A0A565BDI7_9BRAS|nr:unnamed protein product [Arabis nemorensis]